MRASPGPASHRDQRAANSAGVAGPDAHRQDFRWRVFGWLCRWTWRKYLWVCLVEAAAWFCLVLLCLLLQGDLDRVRLPAALVLYACLLLGSLATTGWLALAGRGVARRTRGRLIRANDRDGLQALERVMRG